MLSTMLWRYLFCHATGLHPTIDLHFCSQGSSDVREVWSKDRVVSPIPDVPTTQKQESAEEFSWNVVCRLNLHDRLNGPIFWSLNALHSRTVWHLGIPRWYAPLFLLEPDKSHRLCCLLSLSFSVPFYTGFCSVTAATRKTWRAQEPCSAKQKLPRHLESHEHSLVPGRAPFFLVIGHRRMIFAIMFTVFLFN